MKQKLYKLKSRGKSAAHSKWRWLKEHPIAVPAVTLGVMVTLAGLGWLLFKDKATPHLDHDSKVVIISHDKVQQVVPTIEPTVGALLARLKIEINRGDTVEPAITTKISQDDFRINIYRAVPVLVVDGTTRNFTYSAATTPRAIAVQTGNSIFPEDKVSTVPTSNFITSGAIGEQVTINRATPVTLNLYNSSQTVRTHAKTVGELVAEKKIQLGKEDQLMPTADSPLVAGQQVYVVRNGVTTTTVTEDIAMPKQYITDTTLAYGTSAVRQAGSPGKKTVTYQINLRNGAEVGRTAIQTVVTQEPVTQIEVRGSSLSGIKGDMGLAGIAPGDYTYVDYIVSKESNWNPNAQNASGAYGLCQALPGSKMASAGSDWASNPVTQLRWCNSYAVGHYGSWAGAYSFWVSHRWW